jgi:hypothetical protein
MKPITHIHVGLRSRICGSKYPVSNTSTWHCAELVKQQVKLSIIILVLANSYYSIHYLHREHDLTFRNSLHLCNWDGKNEQQPSSLRQQSTLHIVHLSFGTGITHWISKEATLLQLSTKKHSDLFHVLIYKIMLYYWLCNYICLCWIKRVLMMYNTKKYWASGLRPTPGILNARRHNVSETESDSFSGEARDTPTLLGGYLRMS